MRLFRSASQASRSLSLRATLLSIISALALLIGTTASWQVWHEWRRLEQLQPLSQSVEASAEMFETIQAFTQERELVYMALHAPNRQMPELSPEMLQAAQEKADTRLHALLEAIRGYDLPRLSAPLQLAEERFRAVQRLRAEIELSMQGSVNADEALPERWFEASTEMIRQLQELWMQFTWHFTPLDPIVTQRIMFQHFLDGIMDYAGRERSVAGALLISGTKTTPEQEITLARWHGVVEQGWRMVSRLADRARMAQAVDPLIEEARQYYDVMYALALHAVYRADTSSGKQEEGTGWFKASAEFSAALEALKTTAWKETYRYVRELGEHARQTLAIHSIMLIFAIGLCSYSFYIITRRVLKPVDDMVEALLAASLRQTGETLSHAPEGRDEIAKLGLVLDAFRAGKLEIERTQEKLEASYAYLENLLNHIPYPIFMKDRQHRWIGGNKAFWELMGGPPEKFLGKSDYDFFPKEEADVFWEKDNKVFESTGSDTNEEYFTDAKGIQHVFHTKKVAFLNERKEQFLVGVINDVTEAKEAEAELIRHARALERSNKELDDFAYIASHDLKEPLRGIHNHARFLLEDNEEKLSQESVTRLQRLIYLSQRMERLVNDLLYFSRIGRQELAIQPTDLNAVIHDIQATLELLITERNARITIPVKLPVIVCDKPRVTELFRNLIVNAIKYNKNSLKSVEVGFLQSSSTSDGIMMRNVFYVKDNGQGIAPEFHQDIFRIFKRLQASKDQAEEGTGVGLTFVKKIVERHGGRIWVESVPEKGSTFYFTLQESPDAAKAAA